MIRHISTRISNPVTKILLIGDKAYSAVNSLLYASYPHAFTIHRDFRCIFSISWVPRFCVFAQAACFLLEHPRQLLDGEYFLSHNTF